MTHVLVTGANGFVGRALCRALLAAGHAVTGVVRRPGQLESGISEWVDASVDFAGIDAYWSAGLEVDCVVHLAARVHVMHEEAADPDAAFQATNVAGALRVADAARRHGVRRFVFVSSVKALAEGDAGRPLREDDLPAPQDAYGRSKLAAERALSSYGDESGLDVVIVRPPLVYGPEVRANFLRLMDGIWKRVPLPFGMIDAHRSLLYVDNLADALIHCATDPRAARQCFHVADSETLSVEGLARALARHLQKSGRVLPVPPAWLRLAGRLTGHGAEVERLVGTLRLDTARIRTVLGWQPPFSADEGLAETARWYRSTH
ncbi:SDR family oxidoreductase [Paraburkholderia bryophila]|uniref:UDP-glucose 4-epimerase family protein n=1 Tax=Paraburkholderia bryophila TaxID=420952 RepID=UPI00234BF8FA|nr:SDR family oxidoreductase [Paraburkholderia bryophila]WCM20561.1 SDR family oxidoreductase [Paraburkholderia bryophila]